jgi:hypothetical protein
MSINVFGTATAMMLPVGSGDRLVIIHQGSVWCAVSSLLEGYYLPRHCWVICVGLCRILCTLRQAKWHHFLARHHDLRVAANDGRRRSFSATSGLRARAQSSIGSSWMFDLQVASSGERFANDAAAHRREQRGHACCLTWANACSIEAVDLCLVR